MPRPYVLTVGYSFGCLGKSGSYSNVFAIYLSGLVRTIYDVLL
jgi:hypothetical protein